VSIALYRRYRPETFAEVIGQTQVTVPLTAAFRSGRVNHAYLFSGPRGCGKTTSARILARTLNCVENTPENPIDTPCGVCPSCRELSRDGNGSLDVVEIDAASHGGVDAARDLRERATFTPTRDRYKIFIIDEAHMVTKEGFNALLKVVEEPPPHIKFVFATTEPDKVLGTIRSRTHHYPFRLVPPSVLGPYLQDICADEGVTLGEGVLPLVLRAGGGSVRDSLSVLDQLIAGSPGGEVEYQTATGLLGYTSSTILDDAVSAVAAHDGAAIFDVVTKVIDAGITPQRFVEDLLERFRDLIVVTIAGDQAAVAVGDRGEAEVQALRLQAQQFELPELARLGEVISTGLNQMVGATSPRLQLELLLARLIVPAGEGHADLLARVAELERRLAAGGASAPQVVGRRRPPVVSAPMGEQGSGGPETVAVVRAENANVTVPAPASESSEQTAPTQVPVDRIASALAPAPAERPTREAAPVSRPRAEAARRMAAESEATPLEPGRVESESGKPGDFPQDAAPAGRGASVGATPELAGLKADWPTLVAGVSSPVTRSMLTHTVGPVAVSVGEVVIEVQQPVFVQRLSEPKQQTAVSKMLSTALGRQVSVRFALPGEATPAPAVGPEPPVTVQTSPPAGRSTPSANQQTQRTASQPTEVVEPAATPATTPPASALPSSADEDWLAGIPIPSNSHPPAEQATQPQSAPTRPVAKPATESRQASPQQSAPPDSQVPGDAPPKTSPRRSAHAASEQAAEVEDEASPDDPDADAGLTGVEAALKILDGTIIEETYLD